MTEYALYSRADVQSAVRFFFEIAIAVSSRFGFSAGLLLINFEDKCLISLQSELELSQSRVEDVGSSQYLQQAHAKQLKSKFEF